MATTQYGIYYLSAFKMGLFHVVRQGLGGKLSDFYIFYCMVIELDIGVEHVLLLSCVVAYGVRCSIAGGRRERDFLLFPPF
jgi:hypothetical protein